jgi:hypothetical protein
MERVLIQFMGELLTCRPKTWPLFALFISQCRSEIEEKVVFSQLRPLMKLTHNLSNFSLTHILSEVAKTFGKSHSVRTQLSGNCHQTSFTGSV